MPRPPARCIGEVWTLRTERGVGVESLRAMQGDANADPVAFASKAVDFYVTILGEAHKANVERMSWTAL
jgi:hypothetical protein